MDEVHLKGTEIECIQFWEYVNLQLNSTTEQQLYHLNNFELIVRAASWDRHEQ